MSTPIFETHWLIGDEQIYDYREVERRVLAGDSAREVPAESQRKAYELQQTQERWHRESIERYDRLVQEQAFRKSPEGRAAAARRDAAEHGSRVTVCGSHDATPFDELDQYGPDATNLLK